MSNESWKTVFDYGQYIFAVLAALCAVMNIYFGNLINKQNTLLNKEKENKIALQGQISTPIKKITEPSNSESDSSNKDTEEDFAFSFGNGTLQSSSGSITKGNIVIQVGSVEVGIPEKIFESGIYISSIIELQNGVELVCKISREKLLVSTKILDRKGNIVCEIEDNQWTINPNNYFKKNNDLTALEVIDQNGNVALSVELINEKLVQVYGIFPSEKEIVFAVPNNLVSLPSDPLSINQCKNDTGRNWIDLYNMWAKKIPRKFKYGNDSYGERIN